MNAITKTIVSNKLSSLGKNIGFDDDEKAEDNDRPLTSKELRKMQERDEAEKAKREEKYAKRSAEREKKREDMRAKYGLTKDQKDDSKGQSLGRQGIANSEERKQSEKNEDKQCTVM